MRVGDQVLHARPGAPGGVRRLFVDLGEPAGVRTPPARQAELDVDRVATLARHYGAEILTDWP